MGRERIAEVGDPRRAGRPLDGRAEEVKRRRRGGRQHDVDLLPADEANGDRQRERAPGDVLIRNEEPSPEQRRLRTDARETLLGEQPFGGSAGARPDVAHAVDPGLRRQLQLGAVRQRAGHVRGEHVRLDPERRQVRRELERPLHSTPATGREVARHEQNLHCAKTSGTGKTTNFPSW
jgi:hypothetical protein